MRYPFFMDKRTQLAQGSCPRKKNKGNLVDEVACILGCRRRIFTRLQPPYANSFIKKYILVGGTRNLVHDDLDQ